VTVVLAGDLSRRGHALAQIASVLIDIAEVDRCHGHDEKDVLLDAVIP